MNILKMAVKSDVELQNGTSEDMFCHSYFALIPLLKWKVKHQKERRIIKIIRQSDICKSHPVFKALLIENVRICCFIVESSGQQSAKILCAYVPYLFAFISKANPKLGKLLKIGNVSSYLNVLQQSDLEYLLNSVCSTTVIIHRGVKKYYPASCVSLITDSFLLSEKSLLYLLNFVIYALKTCAEWLYENFKPLLHNVCSQNYEMVSFIADNFNQLAVSAVKSSFLTLAYLQRSVIFIYRFIGKFVTYLISFINHNSDNSVLKTLKKFCLCFKAFLSYLHSSSAFKHFIQHLSTLFQAANPYISVYFRETLKVVKRVMDKSLPFIKEYTMHAIKEIIPAVIKILNDNLLGILKACQSIKTFLWENKHHIKTCGRFICHLFNVISKYLLSFFQTVLPPIIQFSSSAIISVIMLSGFIIEYCSYFSITCRNCASYIFKNHRELLNSLLRGCIYICKNIYKTASNMQPYMVLILRSFYAELIELIHEIAPTSLACLQEMNSSFFYASKEVVSKSSLAAKRVLPSCYYTVKTVVPPTILATHELIKSSSNAAFVVCPAVFKGVLKIRPELREGIVVVLNDGNKAFLEVVSVSFAASCELKDVVKSVSRNIPTINRAAWEVFKTTSIAAMEVSVTIFNAKTRMLEDFKRAQDVVHSSVLLAEEEVSAAYMDVIFEVRTIVSIPSEYGLLNDSIIPKCRTNYVSKLGKKSYSSLCSVSQLTVNFSNKLLGNTTTQLIQIVAYFYSCIFLFLYSFKCNSTVNKTFDAFYKYVNFLYPLFTSAIHMVACQYVNQCDKIYYHFLNMNGKVFHNVLDNLSKLWYTFKSAVRASWNVFCRLAPEIWVLIEQLSSISWKFLVDNMPGAWAFWKCFCSKAWGIINEFAPHFWRYFSAMTPAMWSSIREVVKKFWLSFTRSLRISWQHLTFLSSEYWMLSNTYLPRLWFTTCSETRKGWKVSCCLLENCWTVTVESSLLSWKFLHYSVARCWRSGRIVTKTGSCLITVPCSVLLKSICIYTKSTTRFWVLLRTSSKLNYLTFNFRFKDLRNVLPVSNIPKVYDTPQSCSPPCSRQLYFDKGMKCILTFVNIFPRVQNIFLPLKMFSKSDENF